MTTPPATAATPRLGEVSIRRAASGDREALATLARLDGASPPGGDEYLLAVEDGVLRAARPIAGGRAIADPFHPTADLVAMLELRAARMGRDGGASRPSRGLRWSVARPRRGRSGHRRAAAAATTSVGLSSSAPGRT